MAKVFLQQVTKVYDDELKRFKKNPEKKKKGHQVQNGVARSKAVDSISVEIPDGSFTVFVGPSGCGKSTTLRMIAGLEEITSGQIYIGDTLVNDVKAGERNISMVFQNYAIYPTMTVKENMTFGLENNKVPKDEIERRVEEVSKIVRLEEFLHKKPNRLSGGQRQRVALARAIVKRPQLYIFDEPLSNLDAKLRNQMRAELIHMHKNLKTTFIYVTHDQVEAMSMADQIVLMNYGEIVQVGSPEELYQNPCNIMAAEFMGTPGMNVIRLEFDQKIMNKKLKEGQYIGYRPEKAKITSKNTSMENALTLESVIETREMLGNERLYRVKNNLGTQVVRTFLLDEIKKNKVNVHIPMEDLYFFDERGDRIYG